MPVTCEPTASVTTGSRASDESSVDLGQTTCGAASSVIRQKVESCEEQKALEPDEVLTPQQAATQEPALPAAHSMLRNAVRWQLASRAVGGPAGNVTPLLGLGGMAVVGAMGECHPTYAALFSSVPCCPFLGSVHFVGPACLLREG